MSNTKGVTWGTLCKQWLRFRLSFNLAAVSTTAQAFAVFFSKDKQPTCVEDNVLGLGSSLGYHFVQWFNEINVL